MRSRPSGCVLIVDDDQEVAATISDAINDLGYRTVCASSGREAVSLLKGEQPAVMFVDMFMPEMSGSEFLGFVRRSSQWSSIPRVIITGTNDPMIGIREDATVLFKPFELEALTQLVEAYCGEN